MADQNEAKTLHRWFRGEREEVRLTVMEYLGEPRFDLRVWICNGDRPTRRGISLPVSESGQLAAAVAALEKAVEEEAAA